MSIWLEKHFDKLLIAGCLLIAFGFLVNGCTRPEQTWNWTKTRIWNRGDGNWFDWRSKPEKKDATPSPKPTPAPLPPDDDKPDGGRRPWHIFRDNADVGDVASPTVLEQETNPMFLNDSNAPIILVLAGVIGFWFFVLTPEQRAKWNPFKTSGGGTAKTTQVRKSMFDAYCVLFDSIPDTAIRDTLQKNVLPYVIEQEKKAAANVNS